MNRIPAISVAVSEQQLDSSLEKTLFLESVKDSGAVVDFIGIARADKTQAGVVKAIELEQYPAMTQQAIASIITSALDRWLLEAVTVKHRIGLIPVGDVVVYVAAASTHRKSALACIEYIMDYLKNDVPLWKKEKK